MKTPKTDSSVRKVFIPKSVAQCLIDLKADQDGIKEVLGNEYQDYNLVMATTFGIPIGDSYLRTKMQEIIDELGLQDVVFHSLRHTSVTYKLKLSGGDIKAVQGDSGHAQADMVMEVYGHILDEDRRKNAVVRLRCRMDIRHTTRWTVQLQPHPLRNILTRLICQKIHKQLFQQFS